MRAPVVLLLVLGALASTTGCGDDRDAPADRRAAAVAVSPADYAKRAERRCRAILVAARRTVATELRSRRLRTPAGDRRYLRSYGTYLDTVGHQLDRLSRLTVPDEPEYRALRRGLRAVTPGLTATLHRNTVELARDPTPETYARVRRSSEDAGRALPVDLFPATLSTSAPSCRTLLGPGGGGGAAPGGLSA
ncbi:hypothetical protein [Patulibacter minatonensis]|uniref:hypothetical protein n=1 Tax=Patulibacter minatonensis TaxID=298163 RepID=UPI000478C2E9|nr:hypothetical protein [Patulibacter minatonensis]